MKIKIQRLKKISQFCNVFGSNEIIEGEDISCFSIVINKGLGEDYYIKTYNYLCGDDCFLVSKEEYNRVLKLIKGNGASNGANNEVIDDLFYGMEV